MFYNPLGELINLISSIFVVLFWGLIIVVVIAVVRAITKSGNVPEKEIIERWSALLPNQVNSDEEFLSLIESELDARNCPYETSRKTFNNILVLCIDQRLASNS